MKEVPKRIDLHPLQHKETGLWMALADHHLPGFSVHAHSEEELAEKVPLALRSYIKAVHGADTRWVVDRVERAPGFGPLDLVARAEIAQVA